MKNNNLLYKLLMLVALFVSKESFASPIDSLENKLSFSATVGTKIGGATPVSFPSEIRKIRSFSPAVPFLVGAHAKYQISNKWGASLGLVFEGKGMNTEATVKGYKTTFNANEDPTENIQGYYTGDISTNVHNLYITIPIKANYQLSQKWELTAGPYVSFAVRRKFFGQAFNGYMRDIDPTGARIDIDLADYDFSKSVRTIDVGMSAGTQYEMSKRFFALAQFDYGFNNIMKTGFESISFGLHNIFLNVGVGIKL